ncbi:MAG: hypothetical protein ABI112_08650, partial [Terracoccus sp.]
RPTRRAHRHETSPQTARPSQHTPVIRSASGREIMSITPQDVRHLIDHNRDNHGPRQQDVSRIVRVLNAHRRATTPHDEDPAPVEGDPRSEAGHAPV